MPWSPSFHSSCKSLRNQSSDLLSLQRYELFLYAARASRNSLQNLRKDFFTKLAQPPCAATEREFWGAPRCQGRSPSQREQTNNKQTTNNPVAALRIC